MNREQLAREAVVAATRLRAEHGIPATSGLCPYDLAVQMKISVSLMDASSLEGMYSPEPRPAIIVGSERPAGRRRYTCGHEIGHHVFGHGYRIDELDESNSSTGSPEEYIAQRFSGALLMPKMAVNAAYSKRGWNVETLDAVQVFTVAQNLGVGFTTLLTHQEVNHKQRSHSEVDSIRKTALIDIRAKILGVKPEFDLFPVDALWSRETVDVEVGDVLVFASEIELKGVGLAKRTTPKVYYEATKQGISMVRFVGESRALQIRVSKRNFAGLVRYRHLEDSDNE
jgi:hypothetical protein